MRISRTLVSFVAGMALCAPAFAATLGGVQGVVMVNRGNGYQTVTGPTQLNPGDVVVVNPGGSAQISYGDGCNVPVEVGAVVTVGAQSPCATQASEPQGPGLGTGEETGLGIVLLNTAAAAGIVLGLLYANKNDKAASP